MAIPCSRLEKESQNNRPGRVRDANNQRSSGIRLFYFRFQAWIQRITGTHTVR
jgi:hypothetical protein